MRRAVILGSVVFQLLFLLSVPSRAFAQGGDVTIFVGAAYPAYDERLVLRPTIPSLPGANVSVTGAPEIRADGGLVVGGALAFELGVVGIEGRIDAADVAFDVTGARYNVSVAGGALNGISGSVTLGDGRLDAERLRLVSVNARLRTPGPIGLVASGGLSYLPSIEIGGTVPVSAEIAGLPILRALEPQLRLTAAPGESRHRLGLNGGAGLRVGGRRVALMVEVRAFYFREYELRFDVDGASSIVTDLLQDLDPIRFDPLIVNAQAGLVFKF